MAVTKIEPEVLAVQKLYEALKPLDAGGQQRVLSATLSLLGLAIDLPHSSSDVQPSSSSLGQTNPTGNRPKGLTEFVSEKQPGTSAQRIVLFAYYRDKFEGFANFAAGDLRPYFAKAKLTPPGNFDRDFSAAVEKGWIHQDADKSYVTQKGVDLVESGFSGARGYGERNAKNKGPHKKSKTSKVTKKK